MAEKGSGGKLARLSQSRAFALDDAAHWLALAWQARIQKKKKKKKKKKKQKQKKKKKKKKKKSLQDRSGGVSLLGFGIL